MDWRSVGKTTVDTHLGVGYRSVCQIANLAMQERGPAQLHRDVRDGVVVVRIVHSLQIVQVAEPQRLPVCRYAVGHASICNVSQKNSNSWICQLFPLSLLTSPDYSTSYRYFSRRKFQRTSLSYYPFSLTKRISARRKLRVWRE